MSKTTVKIIEELQCWQITELTPTHFSALSVAAVTNQQILPQRSKVHAASKAVETKVMVQKISIAK
jgi:hypothetical protein